MATLQLRRTMELVNSITIPKGLVIGPILASSLHFTYLLVCLLCLGKRSLNSVLLDDVGYDLLLTLTYTIVKIVSNILTLAMTYSSILPDWFPMFLGVSIVVTLVTEVTRHTPFL